MDLGSPNQSAIVASAIGFICAILLYGIYFAIFMFSLSLVIRRWRSHPVNKLVAFGTWFLFPLCTVQIVLQFASFCNALFTLLSLLEPIEPPVPNVPYFYAAFGYNVNIPPLTLILPTVGDFIGDLVLLYRCWSVWGRKWTIILLPFIAVVSSTVCMFTAIFYYSDTGLFAYISPAEPLEGLAQVDALEITAFTLPLLSHIVITSLIVGRLYWTSRTAFRSTISLRTTSYIRYIIAVLIESGFLYVITQLALPVLFLKATPALYIVILPALPVYAIAPTLILLRISLTASTEGNHGIPTPIIFGEQPQENWHISLEELGRFGAPREKVLDIARHSRGRGCRSSDFASLTA